MPPNLKRSNSCQQNVVVMSSHNKHLANSRILNPSFVRLIGDPSVWLNFHLWKMNKINYYRWKERLEITKIEKFDREML